MDPNENRETTFFIPVISRLDRLDSVLQILEEKHCGMSSRRDVVCGVGCKTLSSALHEVQHKGTLIDRLALLENRVLQLISLEMYEGNTSKSSSSTNKVSKTTPKDSSELSIKIPKRQDDDNLALHFNTKVQIQDPSMTEQEGTYSADGKETTAQHKGRGQNRKPRKRWLMFRLRC